MTVATKRLFSFGSILMTPGALSAFEKSHDEVFEYVKRHLSGDWGDLSAGDKHLNDEAVKDGSRILSAYHLSNRTKIWIITEAADDNGNRNPTTLLLPEEY